MAPKRNDPCHCDSGKKYKHCHMKADREAEREAELAAKEEAKRLSVPAFASDDLPKQEPDEAVMAGIETLNNLPPDEDAEEIARQNALYDAFEEATYEDQIVLLRTSIEEKALDGELVFSFFNDLFPLMVERGERKLFDELVLLLKSNQPEAYEEENQWFWSWEISNALVFKDEDALQCATDQLIERGGSDLEQFYPVFNMLLYHDRRDVLLRALDKYTMDLSLRNYFEYAQSELNRHFIDLLLHDYLETHTQDTLLDEANIDALRDRVLKFMDDPDDFYREGLIEFLSQAGGKSTETWTMEDFDLRKPPKRSRSFWGDEDEDDAKVDEIDPAVENLRNLSREFLQYANAVENVPFTKAELARSSIVEYIRARHAGELKPVDNDPLDFFGESNKPRRSKSHRGTKKRKNIKQKASYLLLPDHPTMDRYLMRFFGFLSNRPHEVNAFFEMLPTWCRFIQSKGLATEEEVQTTLSSLQALSAAMTRQAEQHDSDPVLGENMQKWREDAGV